MSPPVLLALRTLGLGDLLTAVPALRGLATSFPRHRRLLACPSVLAPLVQTIGAGFETLPTGELEPLLVRRPEVAVNLNGRGPESHRLLLATRPERFIAFEQASVPESWGQPRWHPDEHEVRRWCRLLWESGLAADPADLVLHLGRLPAAPTGTARATLIHPGAKSAARHWPVEKWATVAAGEAHRGRQVLVSAGPGEESLGRRLLELAGLPADHLLHGLALDRLAAAVAASGRVACADTGLAHLATATRTPSVVLFGPTPPQLWGPPADAPHLAIWRGPAGDPLGRKPHSGLLSIDPDEVLAALAELPQRSTVALAPNLAG
ncbi:MAG: glycosyltransferase family 9 protein [Candidatus Dormibacteraeota bacterium]|uniref:Glycosyltransferase family 9 protein n=1 Tax=Candidatus Dormiibacter inghamiae TaxID=3127013 RepID=A0A934NEJ9_9BACT|nr:glycosyltransferase family 9 protein [Candidatus Dormibacteraeota bacterium]MBJ7604747.1 glycosyltransferase family 9 protein [Candidatus Dormibacteraeota bacterium]